MNEKMELTSGREMLEATRARLSKLRKEDPKWWAEHRRSDWARKRFGENLTEKDGVAYSIGGFFDEHRCNLCGNIPNLDENILKINFSFCYEANCEMIICIKCIQKMKDLITKE